MEVTIQELANFEDVIDTRSPAEFAEDHIPGAINLPVLSDSERVAIGLLHKENAFAARRRGASLIAANIAAHLRGALADKPAHWRPLVYCARGGQRSGGMTEIMRRIGWRCCRLCGGYKAYRRYVVAVIAEQAENLKWVVVAGKTGSGKTRLLSALADGGAQTLDLEGLANHRGSVFGSVGVQPSQRRFESLLFAAICSYSTSGPIFVESESRKIGALHIPPPLLAALRRSPCAFYVEADLPARVRHILAGYQTYCQNADLFAAVLSRLSAHAGATFVNHCRRLHANGDMETLVGCLLTDFYDVGYDKSLRKNYAAAFALPPFALNPNDTQSVAAAAAEMMNRYA